MDDSQTGSQHNVGGTPGDGDTSTGDTTSGNDAGAAETVGAHKRQIRRDLLAVRAAMADDEVAQAAEQLTAHALRLPELADARTVAAYVSVGNEPETRQLLAALHDRGTRVLLPVLQDDDDLDWSEYRGPEHLAEAEHPGRIRLYEPRGAPLGPEAVTEADVVLLPGLAVDARGVRMGRGGGSYDRALARVADSGREPVLAVVVYGHEVVDTLPDEPHDQSVHAAITPEGVHRFGG